jgi:hypothetical protein
VALVAREIAPRAQIIADGSVHRCDAVGRNGRSDAAYLLHLEGILAGGLEKLVRRQGLGIVALRPRARADAGGARLRKDRQVPARADEEPGPPAVSARVCHGEEGMVIPRLGVIDECIYNCVVSNYGCRFFRIRLGCGQPSKVSEARCVSYGG